MTTLLGRLRGDRDAQAKLVEEWKGPEKLLAELQEKVAAAEAEAGQIRAELAQAKAELIDCDRDVTDLGLIEDDLKVGVRLSGKLANFFERGRFLGHVSHQDMGRSEHQYRSTLELLDTRRKDQRRLKADEKRLTARLKELEG